MVNSVLFLKEYSSNHKIKPLITYGKFRNQGVLGSLGRGTLKSRSWFTLNSKPLDQAECNEEVPDEWLGLEPHGQGLWVSGLGGLGFRASGV